MAKTELLHGTLDMLILKTLASESMHGFAIAQRIHELSDDALAKGDGAIYPALYRMERKGWVTSKWAQFENNRRAKYYRLTRTGRKKLETAYPLKPS